MYALLQPHHDVLLQANATAKAGNIKSAADKQKRKFFLLKYDGWFHFYLMQLW